MPIRFFSSFSPPPKILEPLYMNIYFFESYHLLIQYFGNIQIKKGTINRISLLGSSTPFHHHAPDPLFSFKKCIVKDKLIIILFACLSIPPELETTQIPLA